MTDLAAIPSEALQKRGLISARDNAAGDEQLAGLNFFGFFREELREFANQYGEHDKQPPQPGG